MKRTLIFAFIALMLLPALVLGCSAKEAEPSTTTVEYSTDDFLKTHDISKDIEVTHPGTITVKLGANPTTGYQWAEDATISSDAVKQSSHKYNEPESSGTVGAPGEDVWEFDTQKTGTATITFKYARSWESGDPASTLTLNVTVK